MIPSIKFSPVAVAGGLLAISLAINLWQINRHVKIEKKLTTAEEAVKTGKRDLAGQVKLTAACSDSVDAMARAAEEAKAAHAKALLEAQKNNSTHQGRAQKILSTAPSVPGDTCKSITSLVGDWRKGRAP